MALIVVFCHLRMRHCDKVENILKGSLDSFPITFTCSENSNFGRESLLEMERQNIAGHCQQTFENKKFVDISQQCFALLPQVNFPANNLDFLLKVMGSNPGYLLKSFLL